MWEYVGLKGLFFVGLRETGQSALSLKYYTPALVIHVSNTPLPNNGYLIIFPNKCVLGDLRDNLHI